MFDCYECAAAANALLFRAGLDGQGRHQYGFSALLDSLAPAEASAA